MPPKPAPGNEPYRLTADHTADTGARWAKGKVIHTTADEVTRRGIPAEPVNPGSAPATGSKPAKKDTPDAAG